MYLAVQIKQKYAKRNYNATKEEKAGEETYKCEIKNGVKKRLTGKKLRTGERNIQVGKLQRC